MQFSESFSYFFSVPIKYVFDSFETCERENGDKIFWNCLWCRKKSGKERDARLAKTSRFDKVKFMYNILLVFIFGVQYKLVIRFFTQLFDFVERIYFFHISLSSGLFCCVSRDIRFFFRGRKMKRLFGYFRYVLMFFPRDALTLLHRDFFMLFNEIYEMHIYENCRRKESSVIFFSCAGKND